MYIYTLIYIYIYMTTFTSTSTIFSWPRVSPLQGWGSLTMAFTGKFVYLYDYLYRNLIKINVLTDER